MNEIDEVNMERIDLRSISDCREIETAIDVFRVGTRGWSPWITLGYTRFSLIDNVVQGYGLLDGYMANDATDSEEDPARVLRLPLATLPTGSYFYGAAEVTAMVVSDPSNFRVPPNGYNPLAHPETVVCRACKPRHPIVPEGFYLPPFDEAIYNAARGRIVRISFSPPKLSKSKTKPKTRAPA